MFCVSNIEKCSKGDWFYFVDGQAFRKCNIAVYSRERMGGWIEQRVKTAERLKRGGIRTYSLDI